MPRVWVQGSVVGMGYGWQARVRGQGSSGPAEVEILVLCPWDGGWECPWESYAAWDRGIGVPMGIIRGMPTLRGTGLHSILPGGSPSNQPVMAPFSCPPARLPSPPPAFLPEWLTMVLPPLPKWLPVWPSPPASLQELADPGNLDP